MNYKFSDKLINKLNNINKISKEENVEYSALLYKSKIDNTIDICNIKKGTFAGVDIEYKSGLSKNMKVIGTFHTHQNEETFCFGDEDSSTITNLDIYSSELKNEILSCIGFPSSNIQNKIICMIKKDSSITPERTKNRIKSLKDMNELGQSDKTSSDILIDDYILFNPEKGI